MGAGRVKRDRTIIISVAANGFVVTDGAIDSARATETLVFSRKEELLDAVRDHFSDAKAASKAYKEESE